MKNVKYPNISGILAINSHAQHNQLISAYFSQCMDLSDFLLQYHNCEWPQIKFACFSRLNEPYEWKSNTCVPLINIPQLESNCEQAFGLSEISGMACGLIKVSYVKLTLN